VTVNWYCDCGRGPYRREQDLRRHMTMVHGTVSLGEQGRRVDAAELVARARVAAERTASLLEEIERRLGNG